MTLPSAARSMTFIAGLLLALTMLSGDSRAQFVGGTLLVTNGSGEQLNVNVDGQIVGIAYAGNTTPFPNLTPGYKSLLLTNSVGQVRAAGNFFLPLGGQYSWMVGVSTFTPAPIVQVYAGAVAVHPNHEHAHAHPHAWSNHHHHDHVHPHTVGVYHHHPYASAVVLGGAVQVHNRHLVPASIYIGGRLYGTLIAGQVAVYYNVPAGTQEIVASNRYLPSQELHRETINVLVGSRLYVNLMPQVGIIRLVNSRLDTVEVLIDNGSPTLVQPGQTLDLANIAPGPRNLAARLNGQVVQTALAPIYPGQTYTWYLRAETGSIRIVNRTVELFNLVIDGAPQGVLPPNQERLLPNVAAGLRKVIATDGAGQVRSQIDLALNAGETRMWAIEPSGPAHEAHPHMHPHPHAPSPHHHHDHLHPHGPAVDHHHGY